MNKREVMVKLGVVDFRNKETKKGKNNTKDLLGFDSRISSNIKYSKATYQLRR